MIIKTEKFPAFGNVPLHTQVIQFVGGVKKTIRKVVRIDEGELLCLVTQNGAEFLIERSKVLWVERYVESATSPLFDFAAGNGHHDYFD